MRNDPAYRAGQVIVVFVLYGKFAFRQAIPPVIHKRVERKIPIKSSCRTSILSHHRTVVLVYFFIPGIRLSFEYEGVWRKIPEEVNDCSTQGVDSERLFKLASNWGAHRS